MYDTKLTSEGGKIITKISHKVSPRQIARPVKKAMIWFFVIEDEKQPIAV